MAGRPRLPTKLKILKGTAKPSRLPKNEMQPDAIKFIPQYPEGLNEFGKIEWTRICSLLIEMEMLTKIDHTMLQAYCIEWGTYIEASNESIKKENKITVSEKSGYAQISPWVTIAKQSLKAATSIAVQFGFTPSSRGKISMPDGKGKKKKQMDPQGLLKAI